MTIITIKMVNKICILMFILPHSATSYHVSVKTGDCIGAGTDANVFIKIFGSKADTGQLQMKSADNTRNKFERGRTDLFKMEASDIGKVSRPILGGVYCEWIANPLW